MKDIYTKEELNIITSLPEAEYYHYLLEILREIREERY